MMKNKNYQDSETDHVLSFLEGDKDYNSREFDQLLSQHNISKLQLIAENTIDVICLHHPRDGRYLYSSPSTEKIMGYNSEEIKDKTPYDFIHPSHHSILLKNLSNSTHALHRSQTKLELLFKTKNNGYQWFEGYTKPIYDKMGKVVLLLSCTRNIQERKLAEIEKKKREVIQQNLLVSSILFEKKKAIIEKIENEILQLDSEKRKILKVVLSRIQETLNLDENWSDFLVHYKNVHPEFYQNISESFPKLSQKDLKHLALLKIGMTSTEIAKAMLVKKESLRVSRNRLKQKLGLDSSKCLYEFIQKFE